MSGLKGRVATNAEKSAAFEWLRAAALADNRHAEIIFYELIRLHELATGEKVEMRELH